MKLWTKAFMGNLSAYIVALLLDMVFGFFVPENPMVYTLMIGWLTVSICSIPAYVLLIVR